MTGSKSAKPIQTSGKVVALDVGRAKGIARSNATEVYETILTPYKINFPLDGILFFSPSGVESYLQENKIEDENCFCIGNTTAEALKYVTPNRIIANQPKMESVVMKCIENYKN